MKARKRFFDFSRSFNEIVEKLREEYRELFGELEEEFDTSPLRKARYEEPIIDKALSKEFANEAFASEVRREIEKYGIEAIAVYLPFHFTIDWGIYIVEENLIGLSYMISRESGLPLEDSLICCERAVIEHESFHFQLEYCATMAETILRKPLYSPYRDRFKPYNEDEEAIANATMLASMSPYIGRIRRELQRLCDISPPGYSDYSKYLQYYSIRRALLLDYEKVVKFLSEVLLGESKAILFPTKREMPDSYRLVPIYYLSVTKAPESKYVLDLVFANYRVQDVLSKLKRLFPNEIVRIETGGREPFHIVLRRGGRIPVPYHSRKGGAILVKIVNEFADAIGKDRKEVRELVRRDP